MGSSFEIFLNVVSARMEIAVLRHKCYHKLYCYHIVKNFFREGRLKVDKSQYLTTGELAKLMHVTSRQTILVHFYNQTCFTFYTPRFSTDGNAFFFNSFA